MRIFAPSWCLATFLAAEPLAAVVLHEDAPAFPGYAVVVKTAGRKTTEFFTKDLLPRYQQQLSRIGVQLAILHFKGERGEVDTDTIGVPPARSPRAFGQDVDGDAVGGGLGLPTRRQMSRVVHDVVQDAEVTVEVMYPQRRSTLVVPPVNRMEPWTALPRCLVTWAGTKEVFGPDTRQEGGKLSRNAHSFHDQNVLLWWRHCKTSLDHADELTHVWFVESDAFFNGDVGKFLQSFVEDKADLIAAGFRIAGPKWWKYKWFEPIIEKGQLREFTNVSGVVRDEAGEAVVPLPGLGEGGCWGAGGLNDTTGLLFFQDHMMRLSGRLLEALNAAMKQGILGPSDAYISTACASRVGFEDGAPDCVLRDFAPIGVRDSSRWVSPNYCSNQQYDASLRLHCDSSWQGRWIHKLVNANKRGAMDC